MWIKFNDKTCKIVASNTYEKIPELTAPEAEIPINTWMHIVETEGMLFIDGKQIKGGERK